MFQFRTGHGWGDTVFTGTWQLSGCRDGGRGLKPWYQEGWWIRCLTCRLVGPGSRYLKKTSVPGNTLAVASGPQGTHSLVGEKVGNNIEELKYVQVI